MKKTYADFMNEITADELYRGLLSFGMFAEKLPPIFSSINFYDYCFANKPTFSTKETRHLISYESMRNTNVPRLLSIPNPFSYHHLCRCLADNWDKLCDHFKTQTNGHRHKTSRVHIRKFLDSKALFISNDYDISVEKYKDSIFEMNYHDWRTDGNPEMDILIGKQWIVKADIATFFPSIYTHSLPWALVGKETAKQNRNGNLWYNKIDKYCQSLKDGETHGIPIGPHSSNILSEIILTVVDCSLCSKWEYIRNVDDYTCYVKNREDAELFLTELNEQLRYFDLTLNHKKTEILELPIAATEHWKRRMENIAHYKRDGRFDFNSARSYLDTAIELMKNNNFNTAILNYAIKALSNQKMSDNAKTYCIKTILHLAYMYPYLVPLLDKYIFECYAVEKSTIEEFTKLMLENGLRVKNYETVSFCVYFALKYNFTLAGLKVDSGINSTSCIFKMLLFLYAKKYFNKNNQTKLIDHAKELLNDKVEFEQNWLFVYECLRINDFKSMGDWKAIKDAGVSFISI